MDDTLANYNEHAMFSVPLKEFERERKNEGRIEEVAITTLKVPSVTSVKDS